MITAGAQHGLLLSAGALARPGEVILTEELTYYGIKSIASLLDIKLQGLAMDERACGPTPWPWRSAPPGPRALLRSDPAESDGLGHVGGAAPGDRRDLRRPRPAGDRGRRLRLPARGAGRRCPPWRRSGASTSPACRSPWRRACGSATCAHPWPSTTGSATALRASTLMASPFMAEAAARLIRGGQAKQATDASAGRPRSARGAAGSARRGNSGGGVIR